jgi:excisionase family DNA binding protein
MENLMLRPAEAAELIGVGRTTFYKLVKAKEVPTCLLGKSIRIPLAPFRKWAEEKGLRERTKVTIGRR